jgi:hypothetical protein
MEKGEKTSDMLFLHLANLPAILFFSMGAKSLQVEPIVSKRMGRGLLGRLHMEDKPGNFCF